MRVVPDADRPTSSSSTPARSSTPRRRSRSAHPRGPRAARPAQAPPRPEADRRRLHVPALLEGPARLDARGRRLHRARPDHPGRADHRGDLRQGARGPARRPSFVTPRSTFIPDYDTPRFRLTPAHFAYVKIAEGCNHPCTFCIIPQIRGRHRSRTVDSVVAEAASSSPRA
jgi:hypothetical protein